MSRRWILFLVLALSHIQRLHARNEDDLHVFVVDRAETDALVLHAAAGQAARLLAVAGVKTSWTLCSASSILPGRPPCAKAGSRSITVRVLPPAETEVWPVGRDSCGIAVAGAPGEHGNLAIIATGCIERLSNSRPAARVALLAHVIAHEIGHLLLGRDSHSSSGLMRAPWTRAELSMVLRGQFAFSNTDAARLREAMSSRLAASRQAWRP